MISVTTTKMVGKSKLWSTSPPLCQTLHNTRIITTAHVACTQAGIYPAPMSMYTPLPRLPVSRLHSGILFVRHPAVSYRAFVCLCVCPACFSCLTRPSILPVLHYGRSACSCGCASSHCVPWICRFDGTVMDCSPHVSSALSPPPPLLPSYYHRRRRRCCHHRHHVTQRLPWSPIKIT